MSGGIPCNRPGGGCPKLRVATSKTSALPTTAAAAHVQSMADMTVAAIQKQVEQVRMMAAAQAKQKSSVPPTQKTKDVSSPAATTTTAPTTAAAATSSTTAAASTATTSSTTVSATTQQILQLVQSSSTNDLLTALSSATQHLSSMSYEPRLSLPTLDRYPLGLDPSRWMKQQQIQQAWDNSNTSLIWMSGLDTIGQVPAAPPSSSTATQFSSAVSTYGVAGIIPSQWNGMALDSKNNRIILVGQQLVSPTTLSIINTASALSTATTSTTTSSTTACSSCTSQKGRFLRPILAAFPINNNSSTNNLVDNPDGGNGWQMDTTWIGGNAFQTIISQIGDGLDVVAADIVSSNDGTVYVMINFMDQKRKSSTPSVVATTLIAHLLSDGSIDSKFDTLSILNEDETNSTTGIQMILTRTQGLLVLVQRSTFVSTVYGLDPASGAIISTMVMGESGTMITKMVWSESLLMVIGCGLEYDTASMDTLPIPVVSIVSSTTTPTVVPLEQLDHTHLVSITSIAMSSPSMITVFGTLTSGASCESVVWTIDISDPTTPVQDTPFDFPVPAFSYVNHTMKSIVITNAVPSLTDPGTLFLVGYLSSVDNRSIIGYMGIFNADQQQLISYPLPSIGLSNLTNHSITGVVPIPSSSASSSTEQWLMCGWMQPHELSFTRQASLLMSHK